MAVEFEDEPETQCVGQGVSVGTAARRNEIREVQAHHTVFETNAQAKILQIALAGVLVIVAGAQEELVLIGIFSAQAELQALELVLAGERRCPAAGDGMVVINGQVGGVRGRIAGWLRRHGDQQFMHIEADH